MEEPEPLVRDMLAVRVSHHLIFAEVGAVPVRQVVLRLLLLPVPVGQAQHHR
jgi:hypothetical protein